jgi:GT2 family glycosyltransferase
MMGIDGTVKDGLWFNYFRVIRALRDEKLSIIIPTRNTVLLDRCIKSIESKTKYKNYEIIVMANNIEGDDHMRYLKKLESKHRVIYYNKPFNFSAMNNYAASIAKGEHLFFLNDDTEVLLDGSIEAMLEHSQREEVGAVGAKLLFPNNTIQHAGVVMGLFDSCEHFHKFHPADDPGYLGSLMAVRNFSAVTAACVMIPRRVFEKAGGFDEKLSIVFNDIDLCLRIRSLGYLIVYTPYTLLYHYEHATRKGILPLHPEDQDMLLKERWKEIISKGDPYFNPNLSRYHYYPRPRFDVAVKVSN